MLPDGALRMKNDWTINIKPWNLFHCSIFMVHIMKLMHVTLPNDAIFVWGSAIKFYVLLFINNTVQE